MRTLSKALLIGALAGALPAQALAYTISGVIPPGHDPVVINLHKPIRPGKLTFTFIAPPKNAGVRYALDFCIGPAENPCGRPDSHVVNVPEGEARTESFNSALFSTNVLVVGQGTREAVPYTVQVN